MLQTVEEKQITEAPFTEMKNIAITATKQALQWVLEKKDSPLTF